MAYILIGTFVFVGLAELLARYARRRRRRQEEAWRDRHDPDRYRTYDDSEEEDRPWW